MADSGMKRIVCMLLALLCMLSCKYEQFDIIIAGGGTSGCTQDRMGEQYSVRIVCRKHDFQSDVFGTGTSVGMEGKFNYGYSSA